MVCRGLGSLIVVFDHCVNKLRTYGELSCGTWWLLRQMLHSIVLDRIACFPLILLPHTAPSFAISPRCFHHYLEEYQLLDIVTHYLHYPLLVEET